MDAKGTGVRGQKAVRLAAGAWLGCPSHKEPQMHISSHVGPQVPRSHGPSNLSMRSCSTDGPPPVFARETASGCGMSVSHALASSHADCQPEG